MNCLLGYNSYVVFCLSKFNVGLQTCKGSFKRTMIMMAIVDFFCQLLRADFWSTTGLLSVGVFLMSKSDKKKSL